MDLRYIDRFYERLGSALVIALNELDEFGHTDTHWVVVDDDHGIALSQTDAHEVPAHEVLDSLIGRGARGAGYATYARGRHQVVVSVMVNDPPNSDIRVANVNIDRGTLTLADWQYTV